MTKQRFDQLVDALRAAKDSTGSSLNLESIYYTDGNGTQHHDFKTPEQVNLRSIAKPIVCLALGVSIDEGMIWDGQKVALSMPVWPYLSQIARPATADNERAWRSVTLRDLLRSTLGHDKGLLFSKDIRGRDPASLLDYVLNYPVTKEVGHDFVYSNAGIYVLSHLISKFAGMELDQFVLERLLRRMDVSEVKWDRHGNVIAGCTGLWMNNRDLHKIGILLLKDGKWDARQLVSATFVSEMRSPQVQSPTHRYIADRAFPKWSYGLGLWICEDGSYYCDGTDGQYLVVVPTRDTVVTVLANQSDTVPISDALGLLK